LKKKFLQEANGQLAVDGVVN